MLFLVSHANENDDQSYTIKHVFLHASSLLRAQVYVHLYGYIISPEFYEPEENEDTVDPTEDDVNRYLNNTIEYFEELNKECSQGEHYWHSIKEIKNLNNQYPLQIGDNEQGKSLFKLTVQINYPCSKHFQDNITYYDIEQNTDIYQFQAENIENVIEHIFTHLQDYKGLTEFCEQINQTSEQLAKIDWQNILTLCQANLQQCNQSLENCQKQRKININCEKISQLIPVFHSKI